MDRGTARQPRTHWYLLLVLLLVLGAALTLNAYAQHSLGRSGTRPRDPTVLAGLSTAGPVLDLSGPDVRSASGSDHTVALTFDDGPDPRWTPQVLSVLQRHHVPATFFVVGSRVLAHPDLVRAERRAGNEIGSHTFVHANVGAISGWHANLELSLTQSALAATIGIHTGLFRPPYSAGTDAVAASDFRAWRAIAHRGYLVVLANRSTEDWARPGVTTILANALPAKGTGTVVMFHDGGGDRSQTVEALDQYITGLQGQGYRFTTVSTLAGLPDGLVNRPVGLYQHALGDTIASLLELGRLLSSTFGWALIVIAILGLFRSAALFLFARRHAGDPTRQVSDAGFVPSVTVVVPAYNEEVGIEAAVRSLATADYPGVEVIVVDDGSTDHTADIVAGLQLPNVRLVRQANAGKAAALNAGIALAHHDIVVTVDGDTVFVPATIGWLVQPFAQPLVGAVSGNTKVGNRRGLLGRWQHIEYVLGFNLDRRMYDILGCMPTVPGAIGAFRRDVLTEIGGVSTDTLAEDTDLTMAVIRAGWRVVYEQRAVAWTEAPASLSALWKQRYRWSYGTMQAMWKHRGALSERGPLGRRALPYLFLFQVLLPFLAPIVDLFTVFGVFFLRPAPLIAYWLAFNAVSLALAVYAFRLDGEPMRPLWALPVQQFVYRQVMYLVVIQSVVTAVSGRVLGWHKLERTGEMEVAPGH
ncbi:MAG: glycosyltransferase [Acidimicrobiales bacterium]